MRTLLLVAALFVTASIPSRHAEACGNYRPEPQVFRLSSHTIFGSGTQHRQRLFVVLPGQAAPDELAWRRLAPRSYDATKIADGSALAHPMTFTLVGPAGAKLVTSTKQVWLSRPWEFDRPVAALEIPASAGFSIAIEGNHPNAKWTALERATTPRGGKYVSRVNGSDAKLVSFYSSKARKFVTVLEVGEKQHGQFAGHALGAFTNDGVMKLVVADGSQASQVFLAMR